MSQAEYENFLEMISTENGHYHKPVEFNVQNKGFSRRDVLKGMGVLVVGFSLSGAGRATGAALTEAGACEEASATVAALGPPNDALDSFIMIAQDNSVTVFTSKVDMGQGTMTGFMQVMAEELDVAFSQVTAVVGDTDLVPSADGATLGSNAISGSSTRWRHAAASARKALLDMAAKKFNVDVSKLSVSDGVVSVVGSNPLQKVSYGELIGGQRFNLPLGTVPAAGTLQKPYDQYKIVGKPIARVDIPGKLTGEFEYVHDVRLPGMLYARAVRPRGQSLSWRSPGPKGETGPYSVLESVDETSVAGVKGLVKVVPIGDMGNKQGFGGQFNFVGVVCEREEQAIEAARKLKVTWGTPPEIPADLYEYLKTTHTASAVPNNGQRGTDADLDAALTSAATKLERTYRFPFQMHASIGAVCAVADVKGDRATIWSSTQGTYGTRTSVANALGIPQENVRVIWRSGAGSYGNNNGQTIAAVDAALLSKAVGKPVKLQWFREDTHGWESYGPLHLFNLKAGMNAAGLITSYSFEVYGSGVETASSGTRYTFATNSGSAIFKLLAHNATTYFLTSPLRAPNAPATSFAVECFLDELAFAARMDPLEFRLRHLDPADTRTGVPGPRVMETLRQAGAKFGWDSRPSPNPANVNNRTGVVRGRGIAYGGFSSTHVAEAVEVEVDQKTGDVRVLRVVAAHDCGLIINPESLKQQIEGNIAQTTGRALWEEVKHDGRRVSTLDWLQYPIVRFSQVPKVESVLIDNGSKYFSSGAGEPATVPLPAAIANAIFDATGARVRQIPLTPDRVKAALDAR
jgi:CO/xanthine dehydrogenase Mo-binding subunit